MRITEAFPSKVDPTARNRCCGSGRLARGSVDALHLTQSPENGRDWVPAERLDLRASHASDHAQESDGRAPGGLDSIEPNNGRGAILACRDTLGSCKPESLNF